MDKYKKRDSSLELLRIISMIIIIASHYAYFGIGSGADVDFSNFCISRILWSVWGITGILVNFAYGWWYSVNYSSEIMFNAVWNGYSSISILIATASIFMLVVNSRPIKIISSKLKYVIVEISKNTLGIYFFHLIVGNVLDKFFPYAESVAFGVPYGIIIFLISLGLSEISRRIPIWERMVTL